MEIFIEDNETIKTIKAKQSILTNHFHDNLKILCEEKGLKCIVSIAKFISKNGIGISYNAVKIMLEDKRMASKKMIENLMHALDCNHDDLISEENFKTYLSLKRYKYSSKFLKGDDEEINIVNIHDLLQVPFNKVFLAKFN